VRIVSLLPSTTEILFAIGAGGDVVGVTVECDYPPEARSRRIVSTSVLPSGLSAAEIDTAVSAALARGEDLYHLDRDHWPVWTRTLSSHRTCVRCALLT
jgi:iron complex transport system substrate-binding protein